MVVRRRIKASNVVHLERSRDSTDVFPKDKRIPLLRILGTGSVDSKIHVACKLVIFPVPLDRCAEVGDLAAKREWILVTTEMDDSGFTGSCQPARFHGSVSPFPLRIGAEVGASHGPNSVGSFVFRYSLVIHHLVLTEKAADGGSKGEQEAEEQRYREGWARLSHRCSLSRSRNLVSSDEWRGLKIAAAPFAGASLCLYNSPFALAWAHNSNAIFSG